MIVLEVIIAVLVLFAIAVIVFTRTASFGSAASGQRLERINSSPNYKEGKFQNLSHTPDIAEGVSYITVMRDFFFKRSKRSKPSVLLPSKKTDLKMLDPQQDVFVWFGHSGYFLQVAGKRIVVDPVLSGAASPVAFTTRSFPGADVYTADELPDVDYLIITHDHWDHLDYKTVVQLSQRAGKIITSLGTGAHLERWGIPAQQIVEHDWWETTQLEGGFKVTATPARHFSGRGFKRNQALWSSFVLETPTKRLFIGGDSGYDSHFREIGNRFGPMDVAILECGQYHAYWKYIHMMPEETVQAAAELNARYLIPVHWAKFSLALHDWDDPAIRAARHAEKEGVTLLTPMIGEQLNLNQPATTARWWEELN